MTEVPDERTPECPVRMVLLVDDEPLVARGLDRLLLRRGYLVLQCGDMESAIDMLRTYEISVVLLDYALRDADGLELCRALGARYPVPIIMLTGNASPELMVACLEAGADDYVTKPFNVDVLVSRMNAVIRRFISNRDPSDLAPGREVFEVDHEVVLDVRRCELRNSERSMRLSNSEAAMLASLLRADGELMTRDELSRFALMRPWHYGDRTVDVIVSRLRSKLRKLDSTLNVHSLRNRGYLLRGRSEYP